MTKMRMKTCSAFPYFLSGMYYRPGYDVKLATKVGRPHFDPPVKFTKGFKNPPKKSPKNSLDKCQWFV